MSSVIFLLIWSLSAPDLSVHEVRLQFHAATSSEKVCSKLIVSLERYTEKDHPLYTGYRGGANMVMAKHVLNPFNKLSYFKRGRDLLERAIRSDRNNVELRFLRYTIQTNVPGILGYKSNLEADRQYIERSLGTLKDAELKKIIIAYLKQKS